MFGDWWMEEGKNRERVGELIMRQGFQKLLEVTGIKAAGSACSNTREPTPISSGKKMKLKAAGNVMLKNTENTIKDR